MKVETKSIGWEIVYRCPQCRFVTTDDPYHKEVRGHFCKNCGAVTMFDVMKQQFFHVLETTNMPDGSVKLNSFTRKGDPVWIMSS